MSLLVCRVGVIQYNILCFQASYKGVAAKSSVMLAEKVTVQTVSSVQLLWTILCLWKKSTKYLNTVCVQQTAGAIYKYLFAKQAWFCFFTNKRGEWLHKGTLTSRKSLWGYRQWCCYHTDLHWLQHHRTRAEGSGTSCPGSRMSMLWWRYSKDTPAWTHTASRCQYLQEETQPEVSQRNRTYTIVSGYCMRYQWDHFNMQVVMNPLLY